MGESDTGFGGSNVNLTGTRVKNIGGRTPRSSNRKAKLFLRSKLQLYYFVLSQHLFHNYLLTSLQTQTSAYLIFSCSLQTPTLQLPDEPTYFHPHSQNSEINPACQFQQNAVGRIHQNSENVILATNVFESLAR